MEDCTGLWQRSSIYSFRNMLIPTSSCFYHNLLPRRFSDSCAQTLERNKRQVKIHRAMKQMPSGSGSSSLISSPRSTAWLEVSTRDRNRVWCLHRDFAKQILELAGLQGPGDDSSSFVAQQSDAEQNKDAAQDAQNADLETAATESHVVSSTEAIPPGGPFDWTIILLAVSAYVMGVTLRRHGPPG